ncbi:MAG: BamA/TamA family outer membrane protein [Candidatus Eiseniibacteriota bacterium]|jgi:hypothetical protein
MRARVAPAAATTALLVCVVALPLAAESERTASTPASATPAPATPASATPAPATPAPATPAPATPTRPATTEPAAPTFESYLDSLRARSAEQLERRGVRDAWPAADSIAAIARARGVAFADSARTIVPRRRFDAGLEPALVGFNRVEGLRIGAGASLSYGPAAVEASGAYGFSSEAWRHRERLRLRRTALQNLTVTVADVILPYGAAPVDANGVFAFIAGADDQDYLRQRGVEVRWDFDMDAVTARVAYEVADQTSVDAATDWNLLGRDRGPRPNPDIDDGRVRRLRIGGSGRRTIRALRSAVVRWDAGAEIAGYGLGGDFDYDRYELDVEADLHLPGRDDARLSLELGTARNGPPRQALFYLGGPRRLRAFPVNAFSGDRAFAAALDYHVNTDLLARLGLPWAQIQLVPFYEIGAAWHDPNGRGLLSRPESGDWRSDAGLALQRNFLFGISARLDLAFRLDRARDRLTTRFRFQMPLFDRLE